MPRDLAGDGYRLPAAPRSSRRPKPLRLLSLELGGRLLGAGGGILFDHCSLIGGRVRTRRSMGPSSRPEIMLGGPGENGTAVGMCWWGGGPCCMWFGGRGGAWWRKTMSKGKDNRQVALLCCKKRTIIWSQNKPKMPEKTGKDIPVGEDSSCPSPSPGSPGNPACDWCWQEWGYRWRSEGAYCRPEEVGGAWVLEECFFLKQILDGGKMKRERVRK